MFTGIITAVGKVADTTNATHDGARLWVDTPWDCTAIPQGASVACNGVCLTLVEASGNRFAVDASGETLATTTIADWQAGRRINLERALALGDELGGHLVSGHVDGIGTITRMEPRGDSHFMQVQAPDDLAMFIAPKGSIALDGVSLTVNAVSGSRFDVMIIPHTWTETALADSEAGRKVNLEIDLFARYVGRMLPFIRETGT